MISVAAHLPAKNREMCFSYGGPIIHKPNSSTNQAWISRICFKQTYTSAESVRLPHQARNQRIPTDKLQHLGRSQPCTPHPGLVDHQSVHRAKWHGRAFQRDRRWERNLLQSSTVPHRGTSVASLFKIAQTERPFFIQPTWLKLAEDIFWILLIPVKSL